MNDSWDEMRRAKEDQYFHEQNKKALERLQAKKDSQEVAKLSPVSGKPMRQETLYGVTVDICDQSGGYWFDKGEIEIFLKNAMEEEVGKSLLQRFLTSIKSK